MVPEAGMDSSIVDDLVAEQAVLDDLVGNLSEDQWATPSPAPGWNVRDEIAHLAFFDDLAVASISGWGETRFAKLEAAVRSGDPDFIRSPGEGRPGREVLSWWRQARAAEVEAFRRIDPGARIPWGPNRMAAASLCTARLMETWAHGLDCFMALGAEPVDGERLRHVCHIAYRAIPNALSQARLAMPAPLDDLAVELRSPTGELWRFGRPDAPNRIEGIAAEFARAGVRRMRLEDATTLRATGPLATIALSNLKAYL
jgi:uncharacterized protein (TIGR03084 family)